MSQSKKRRLRSGSSAASEAAGSTSTTPAVDEELTRLAVEALPEAQRRRWERDQRAAAAARDARVTSGEEPDDERDAEELAEEIKASSRGTAPDADPTPVWYQVIMFGLIVIGLAWLILWYLLDFSYPIPGIGYWNVGIGIGLMMVGLLMTTRWR